jgi:hypothetical protein
MTLEQRAILATLAARVVAEACEACDHEVEILQAIADIATCPETIPLTEAEVVALLAHPWADRGNEPNPMTHRDDVLTALATDAWLSVAGRFTK